MFLFCEKSHLHLKKLYLILIITPLDHHYIFPLAHPLEAAHAPPGVRAPHFGNPSSSAMYSEAIFLSLKGNTHSSHIQSQRLRDRLKGFEVVSRTVYHFTDGKINDPFLT